MASLNQYKIEAEIGHGAMGRVYKARNQQGEVVAIKQLATGLTDPTMLERFQREGEALRTLNHPNIVKLLDTFEDDGQHYLVIEYVDGGDLYTLMQEGLLPYDQAIRYAIDLADALTRAHKLEIIHRDLKPANILLDTNGTLRLTDFGVARLAQEDNLTPTDGIVGTIAYLAPELLQGEPADTGTDIWAFGVVLYEMLVGQHPFQGESVTGTITSIISEPIPDLEQLASDLPIPIIDLVYRMLNRDRSARIASVRHIGANLEDILHGRVTPIKQERFQFITVTSDDRKKHNLPAQATSFVGRDGELGTLEKLLRLFQIKDKAERW